MKWYKVLNNSELKYPFLTKAKAAGTTICLVGVDNEVYALAAKCPHAGADISQGWCRDGKLICPFHRYGYDIKTGRGNPGQGDYINTYPVEIREDGIYVGVKSIWDIFK